MYFINLKTLKKIYNHRGLFKASVKLDRQFFFFKKKKDPN